MDYQHPYFGLETEYGIFSDSLELAKHKHDEFYAIRVVEMVETLGLLYMNNGLEGIRDREEHERVETEVMAEIDDQAESRPLPSAGHRQRWGYSGYVLPNGCRFYVDMTHPEYSTPEVSNPRDIVIAQKAGDWITEQCRKRAEQKIRQERNDPDFDLRMYRNNSDGKGNSYAGHENYSLSPWLFNNVLRYEMAEVESVKNGRSGKERMFIPKKSLYTDVVLRFLVTRQIISGAGKVGMENEYGHSVHSVPYQISARADFMICDIGGSTVMHRPIINTRDQPHGDHTIVRRLHLIMGDSNMSELSIYMKFGITALFFMMLEEGSIQTSSDAILLPLENATAAYHAVSHDLTLRRPLNLKWGYTTTALETQWQFQALADAFVRRNRMPAIWHDVVAKWAGILNGLQGTNRAKHELAGHLDWVIKERELRIFSRQTGAEFGGLKCADFALGYHAIDTENCLYDWLLKRGRIMRIVTDEDVMHGVTHPPEDTRAWLRGELLTRYPKDLTDIGWSHAQFINDQCITFPHPGFGAKKELESIFRDNPSYRVFLERILKNGAGKSYQDYYWPRRR